MEVPSVQDGRCKRGMDTVRTKLRSRLRDALETTRSGSTLTARQASAELEAKVSGPAAVAPVDYELIEAAAEIANDPRVTTSLRYRMRLFDERSAFL